MFCPENYSLLSEVRTACIEAAQLIYPWPENYKTPKLPNGDVDWENEAGFKQMFVSKLLFDDVLTYCRSSLFVFSTQTGVFRISGDALRRDIDFCMYDSAIPILERFSQWDISYLFLDRAGWTVSLRNWDKFQNSKNRLYRLAEGNTPDKRVAELMQKVSGFSVCFPSALLDLQPKNLVSKFENSPKKTKPKVGRPERQTQARIAYEQVYPNGHDGISYKVVLKKIFEITGSSFSKDTLIRALKD